MKFITKKFVRLKFLFVFVIMRNFLFSWLFYSLFFVILLLSSLNFSSISLVVQQKQQNHQNAHLLSDNSEKVTIKKNLVTAVHEAAHLLLVLKNKFKNISATSKYGKNSEGKVLYGFPCGESQRLNSEVESFVCENKKVKKSTLFGLIEVSRAGYFSEKVILDISLILNWKNTYDYKEVYQKYSEKLIKDYKDELLEEFALDKSKDDQLQSKINEKIDQNLKELFKKEETLKLIFLFAEALLIIRPLEGSSSKLTEKEAKYIETKKTLPRRIELEKEKHPQKNYLPVCKMFCPNLSWESYKFFQNLNGPISETKKEIDKTDSTITLKTKSVKVWSAKEVVLISIFVMFWLVFLTMTFFVAKEHYRIREIIKNGSQTFD